MAYTCHSSSETKRFDIIFKNWSRDQGNRLLTRHQKHKLSTSSKMLFAQMAKDNRRICRNHLGLMRYGGRFSLETDFVEDNNDTGPDIVDDTETDANIVDDTETDANIVDETDGDADAGADAGAGAGADVGEGTFTGDFVVPEGVYPPEFANTDTDTDTNLSLTVPEGVYPPEFANAPVLLTVSLGMYPPQFAIN